jgi:hyperosmotically inducible periplasmic protein
MNSKALVRSGLAATLLLCAAAQAADRSASADDTAANTADRNSQLATPVDQSNSADAIKITANIRKAVVGDKTLSTSAHNVKIITSGNTVTLRGPVVSTAEKERITSLARQYAPGKDVLDQLTVKGG